MHNKGLLTVAGLFLSLSFNLGAVEVGAIADSRLQIEPGWTLNGSQMTDTRAKLLDPANFGPEGTYPESINITDIEEPINYAVLSALDIFFVGFIRNNEGNAFTANELQAMQEWVTDGGTMLITCDSILSNAVCDSFGPVPSDSNATPPVQPTGAGATRPPFDGPFGQPAELNMAGIARYFADTGGYAVLAEDQQGNPVILEALFGSGRVVIMTDVDIITNARLSDGPAIENDNDRFLANVFAYLADEAGETFFINPGLDGNWWGGPDRAGEGAQLEIVIDGEVHVLVLTFYSYDTAGNQIFLIAVGSINGTTSELEVFITEGGIWGAGFDPDLVNETPFGTGEFSSTSCSSAHLSVMPNQEYQDQGFTELEYDLVRLAQHAGPCPVEF